LALDGLQRSSHAAKEWRGTCADLRQKQEKVEAKVKSLLEAHARADQAGAAASIAEPRAEPDEVQEQSERFAKQAARRETVLAQREPKRGQRGKELQSHVTDNDSANMQTAHGVIQGYNAQALVEAQHQVIVHAEACGNGQADGHVAPMLEGAQATGQALGLPADSLVGQCFSADRNDHSEGTVEKCAPEPLDADIPDPHVRACDPRFATQARHKPQTDETLTGADFTDDKAHDRYRCPQGKVLKREARRHKIGNNIYRRYDADEADGNAGPLREKCFQHVKTRRKHVAVYVESAKETLSQQMIAKIDTPAARKLYGQRRAIVEPVFGNSRSQTR
jgi:hypothetical protein